MAKVQNIMCVCPAGLGSSLILSMKVEAVLKEMGMEGISIRHGSLGEVSRGCADLLVVSSDIYEQCKEYGDCVGVKNMVKKDVIKAALEEYFNTHPQD